MNLLFYSSIC